MAEMVAVGRTAPIAIGSSFAFLTGSGVYIDTSVGDDFILPATLGVALATLGCQLAVMRRLLGGTERRTTGGPVIIGLLLLSTVMTIGISLGVLLLVVPGLYLAARWRVAVPILLAQNVSIGEALNASWQRTEAAWPPLMAASAMVAALYGSTLAIFLVAENVDHLSLVEAIAVNALLYAATVGSWMLDVAAYLLVNSSDATLAETFA